MLMENHQFIKQFIFPPFTNNSSLTEDNDVKLTLIYYSNPYVRTVSSQKKISAWRHVLFTWWWPLQNNIETHWKEALQNDLLNPSSYWDKTKRGWVQMSHLKLMTQNLHLNWCPDHCLPVATEHAWCLFSRCSILRITFLSKAWEVEAIKTIPNIW